MKEWALTKRVLAAIEHKEPDRVPVSFGSTLSTDMLDSPPDSKNYTKLCEYLQIQNYEEADIGFVFNYVNNIDERIMQKFGSDLRRIDPNPPLTTFLFNSSLFMKRAGGVPVLSTEKSL